MGNFLYGRNYNMGLFSTFHIIFIIFILISGSLIIFFFRKCSKNTLKIIVSIAWIIMVLFEIGKQICWGSNLETHEFVKLDVQVFPYQFCSLPYYLFPLFVLLPDSKFKDVLNLFIGTFLFSIGFIYIFASMSLGTRVFINHQTMIHHGLQAIISLLIFIHEREKFNFKKFIWTIPMLTFFVAIAIVLNVVLTKNYPQGVNLWELNPLPGYESQQIVYKDVLAATNYPIFVITYIFIFSLIALGTYLGLDGIIKLITKKKKA